MTSAGTNDGASTTGSTEPWTVLRLLEWTTNFFKSKGSDSARLDAEVLLAHARDCQRIQLYTSFSEVPTDEQRIAFRELVRRRGDGVPVAQLVGFKEFYSIAIRVDENVLVPRPETEHLVVGALDEIKRLQLQVTDRRLRVLDIGTGSGAIVIAIAKNVSSASGSPGVEITAVDVSLPALDIAKWNVEKHKLAEQITLLQSDLFDSLDSEARFDIIVTNPPYVSQLEYDELPPTVKDHEPKGALLSGPTGMETIERILNDSPAYLNPGGRLMIELSPMIAQACEKLAQATGLYSDIELLKDLAGHQRILSVRIA
ncbi:[protein release factor]-glutamine N5-methyltransferase [Neorhodopirellula lusitana]|uniref:Release factor glutamine methyltransferase n=1 Tax=Neorhodopirellula lusitana TaxID=445327 RepID=A0ABY1Q282_9BACT|nr:peptide chain release factor N(5)-glutamine methyltransferase [Neorhodopirellula lusitana]SMP55959.1 [protein release factor]-glutamine N5-methyltransferase [Neorhodopirellula lusitana]